MIENIDGGIALKRTYAITQEKQLRIEIFLFKINTVIQASRKSRQILNFSILLFDAHVSSSVPDCTDAETPSN